MSTATGYSFSLAHCDPVPVALHYFIEIRKQNGINHVFSSFYTDTKKSLVDVKVYKDIPFCIPLLPLLYINSCFLELFLVLTVPISDCLFPQSIGRIASRVSQNLDQLIRRSSTFL